MSKVYISGGRFHFIDLPKAQLTPVAELRLPAGNYLVHGKVVAEIRDQASAGVLCQVWVGGYVIPPGHAAELQDEGIARLAKPLVIQETHSVMDYVQLADDSLVSLICGSSVTGADNGDPDVAWATRVRLEAIPVEAVEVQPGLGSS